MQWIVMESSGSTCHNAEISAGSPMLRESRKIAGLLLDKPDDSAWRQAFFVDNILQKKAPVTARRMAKLVRNRLELATPELWRMVVDGNSEIATQSLMAATIKHSRLLGDFLNEVVKDHYKVFNRQLVVADWRKFLVLCSQRDAAVAAWSESTKAKLGQVVFRILAEAKYVDSTRSLKLAPVSLASEIPEPAGGR
ncbi:MAG: DUF1819 family protein [Syntrophales bacterium]